MRLIHNQNLYLQRLTGALKEKLEVSKYIPLKAKNVLDVGCADGSVTIELAKMFPKMNFFGIDLKDSFIKRAIFQAKKQRIKNISFEKIYLRDLLARAKRYDAVIFISILHEFYSYGEGISSVLKGLADAHELLKTNGEIVIRDMIFYEYMKNTKFRVESIFNKILTKKDKQKYIKDFEKHFGPLETLYNLNHFLLKYFYKENWERECQENYVPVTFEQYEELFKLLNMDLQFKDSYLVPFLKNKWKDDFKLTEDELKSLRSTGFIVARKK